MRRLTERLSISSQVFGKGDLSDAHHKLLESKLELANKRLNLEALMIWGAISDRSINRIVSACLKYDVEPHLWYPVLADTPVDSTEGLETEGLRAAEIIEVSDEQVKTGESFTFLCPSKALLSENLISRFTGILSRHVFKGVFLDRIRFPGPTNGFGGLFSCFCKQCSDYAGEDILKDARMNYEKLFSTLKRARTPDELRVILEEGIKRLVGFYQMRESLVESIVAQYSSQARSQDLSVGLDLFAPSLAPLVSQNYRELSKYADWIKPMLYCKTFGPAGLPAEVLALADIIGAMTPHLNRNSVLEGICLFLGIESAGVISSDGLPLSNFPKQLDIIHAKEIADGIGIYPGFEAVDFPPVYSMDHEHLDFYLRSCADYGISGIVLSWDICKMRNETIEFVGDFIERSC